MIHNLYANEAGYTVHIINTIVHLRSWPVHRGTQDRPDSPDLSGLDLSGFCKYYKKRTSFQKYDVNIFENQNRISFNFAWKLKINYKNLISRDYFLAFLLVNQTKDLRGDNFEREMTSADADAVKSGSNWLKMVQSG